MEPLVPAEFLSQVLRWSVHAHEGGSIGIAEAGFGNGKNPATRKLIEQILFTRRFTPTYLALLAIVVLVFAAVHWWTKLTQWHSGRDHLKKERVLEHDSRTSSSSSSTLQRTPSPKLEASENTRLLTVPEHGLSWLENSILKRMWCRFSSTLAYQPSPVPALTSPSNVLPQNGTMLLILLFLALNIFYLFYHVPLSIPMLFVFADRAGLLFVVNLPVLYILAAKTNQPLKLLTGWSYESLNIFHRRLGELMIIFGVLHSVGMFGVWYTLLRPLHFGLLRFLSTKLVLLGSFALLSYIAIWLTSTGYFRKLWYETFLGLHIFLQAAALVLLFFHHPGARIYVLASVAIWAMDRVVGRTIMASRKFVATLQVAEDGETVLLFCDIDIRAGPAGSSLHISQGWKAGQHVFATVPGIGRMNGLQAHPFTIASPAPPAAYRGSWPLQLTIRAQEGFSRELLDYAKLHQHTVVVLDGPYGSTDVLEDLHAADRKCLIAGGSGIAVTYPLAWSLLVQDDPDSLVSTRTTYRDGQKHIPSLRIDRVLSTRFKDRVMHLWINQHYEHRNWISMLPRKHMLKTCRAYNGSADGTDVDMDLAWSEHTIDVCEIYPTTYSTQDIMEGGPSGRPDIALELRQWMENSGWKEGKERTCVVVSGPDGLVQDVRNAAAKLLREGWNITVFVEKFGW